MISSEKSHPETAGSVSICPPEDYPLHLVFRRSVTSALALEPPVEGVFVLFHNPFPAVRFSRELLEDLGMRRYFKLLIKLLAPTRRYYCFMAQGRVLSQGWVTHGRCRKYDIEPTGSVIGPISTHPSMRGKGLASYAMLAAMNELLRYGYQLFYIDTDRYNWPSRHAIGRAGFGKPIAAVPSHSGARH